MIVGFHKGRGGHTWRLHHHCREHPALLKPASRFHDGLPRLELGSWRGILKVALNTNSWLMWSLRCKASYWRRMRTSQCTQEIKCVECAWTQSKRVVFNPWNSCHCNRHDRHNKLCLIDIQGKKMRTTGESDHWTLGSPGSLQCLILSESSWSKIWDSHGPSRLTETKKPTRGLPPCTRAVRNSHSPKLDPTPDTKLYRQEINAEKDASFVLWPLPWMLSTTPLKPLVDKHCNSISFYWNLCWVDRWSKIASSND